MKPKHKVIKSPTFTLTNEYRATVCSQSYLGKKGYTIVKSILSPADCEFLKKDLFVKPEIFGANFGPADGASQFPVYRENEKKIYLPRFYGIQRYGLPPKSEIQTGDDINVTFTKSLRDYQNEIVGIYGNYVNQSICLDSLHKGSGGILEVPCGRGKCLGKNTQILMFDGTIKLVQNVVVGDLLMGDDSTPRKVLTLARGKEMMYKVNTKKGVGYIVNESHILSLKYSSRQNKNIAKGDVLDISVLDYLNLPKSYHGRGGPLLGYRVPVTFHEVPLEIDPYLIGYWLGDGYSKGTLVTTQESTVIKYIVECFKTKHTTLYLKYTGAQYDYRINSTEKTNILMDFLRDNNMINNKHIPHHYKCNSRKNQLELLAGLIDSDGYYHDGCYEITQKNETLLDDIVFLARSLGFASYKKQISKTCTNARGGPKKGTYYTTNISGAGLEEIPVKCSRKKPHKRELIRDVLKYRISLEQIGVDDYYGFEIDGNRRFVLGDFTVTHNTVMALKIISDLKKKTLIIVHKEFLMNQWIERIEEFLPGSRIGKIQAQVCDIKDKDIVIGMVQTLYDKDFPAGTFDSFGLTIIDEVHRIGSEQFSKTLFKTITPYMLGISATVDRKDKLTRVLYMFIGEKIYEEKRNNDDAVCVRAIEYQTGDSQFNEVEIDYRGNTKYSSMIVKLCEYGPRSDFIVRVLKDLVDEDNDSQIMVLCHNRSLLTYLYQAIDYRKFASVGFYVGGMKQAALQDTESKNIVLATYAMAAEALDIKTLSTLVMVTPKTDIVQSVGRILRVKHENPIIVDIVDKHDVFQNQWLQRRRFYKKSNYRIRYIESPKYTGMSIDWTKDTTWKRIYEPKDAATAVVESEETVLPFGGNCLIDVNFDE
uniref:Helicase ATP-binding domain-containing protein n=1 Tax=viral metagenome TaxID=1070528 RepID=A0A6C0B8S6_9ZZZZ